MSYNVPFLRVVCEKLDIKYSNNAKEETLRKAINSELAYYRTTIEEWEEKEMTLDSIDKYLSTHTKDPSYVSPEIDALKHLSFAKVEAEKAKEAEDTVVKRALKLIRVSISCNDPNKREWEGEIFCARNAVVSEVKKFVPFNVPTHVPQILLNMIKEKELQSFQQVTLSNGVKTKKSKLVPMYNINYLDPLTPDELDAIKRKQLVERKEESTSSLGV